MCRLSESNITMIAFMVFASLLRYVLGLHRTLILRQSRLDACITGGRGARGQTHRSLLRLQRLGRVAGIKIGLRQRVRDRRVASMRELVGSLRRLQGELEHPGISFGSIRRDD